MPVPRGRFEAGSVRRCLIHDAFERHEMPPRVRRAFMRARDARGDSAR